MLVGVVWLASVWLLVLIAQHVYGSPLSLASWGGNWDGAWYRSIVEHGYATAQSNYQVNLAFFPLLPILTWFVKTVTFLPTVWVGMLISTLSFTAALILLCKLVTKQFGVSVARWTLLLLAFNPFSYFFGMMYTESLFLLLAVATFWFLLKKQWWLAALMAGLASGTRSVGVALGAVVILGYAWTAAKQLKWGGRHWGFLQASLPSGQKETVSDRTPSIILKASSIGLLSFSGLILFSLYLWRHTGDPLAYKTAQGYWPGRGDLANLVKETVMLFTPAHINKEYALRIMWNVSAVVDLIGFALLTRMKQRGMAIFTGVALFLPLLFGTAGSMNRYVQVVFPVFIAYAALLVARPRWLRIGVLALMYIGLCVTVAVAVSPQQIFIG